jgi:integrase/recombinase XerD
LHSPRVRRERRGPAAGARTQRDDVLLRLWLDRRSPHTRRAYETDARSLLASAGKPLADMTIADLELWGEALAPLAPASRARKIRAVKSLFSLGKRKGFLSADLGVVLRAPSTRHNSGDRTLSQTDVMRLIAREPNRRNRAMLGLAYLAGLKVSEICGLRWRHIPAEGPDGPLITVIGRQGKSRRVVIPVAMLREFVELRGAALQNEPVFRSAKGGALDPSQVHRIVKQAAARAGLPPAISMQWLRRAHLAHLRPAETGPEPST